MNLHVLAGAEVIRISQNLGPAASGCRLDADGLERTVALAEAALAAHPDLLILNKFGKQEAEGRGFRPLIGEALAKGVPVLTAVRDTNRAAFDAFAEGIAEEIPAEAEAVLAWCRTILADRLVARQ
jgi:nucleoside-triphosphatase THEP1